MLLFSVVTIRSFEFGLEFNQGEFKAILPPGRYMTLGWRNRRIEVVSAREPAFRHPQLDLIIASGALKEKAEVVDLEDGERALVWIDGRFHSICEPGQHVFWTTHRSVRIERTTITDGFFTHAQSDVITRQRPESFIEYVVPAGHVGVLYHNGAITKELPPGRYALWKSACGFALHSVDLRECHVDISGQEIMTADRVTLRMNVLVGYTVSNVRDSLLRTDDAEQALYRAVQLVLREAVGTRSLEQLLADKNVVGEELRSSLKERAQAIGLSLTTIGVRDLILPGEMKALLNQVTEAKAAAEANLITRREETAAMRSQLNTARLFNDHPTLMRLRELEVLERVAKDAQLQVVLGEGGLSDRMSKLI